MGKAVGRAGCVMDTLSLRCLFLIPIEMVIHKEEGSGEGLGWDTDVGLTRAEMVFQAINLDEVP